ncbi:MAG TPA: glycoside hydrolase family 38 C-terminal domain-containing protein, partial [Candidatus Obscuribacterales bacterium]
PWELARLRERLLPLSTWIKQRRLTCVGHAHLDLAWLWPVEDTWRAAERTFRSVLALQAEFPELTYTHSSPALFAWLETHQPELFQQVVAAVQAGTWAIDAGLWVEPELNTLGGESLARQILYGQRYTQSRFGQRSAIAWLPDSFGFSAQLPQLLHLGGIHCFATQKLRWNEATTFPHQLFWWQGLDGTQILSLTLPPIGTAVDPVPMATHGAAWEAHTQRPEALWLPGLGDHGGGPTRDMLTQARRWQVSPFFPQLGFSTVADHLHRLTGRPIDSPALTPEQVPLPIWQDELYLELHRGCYTVHADQKWFNRRCEDALREAELFAAIAHHRGALPYPQAALTTAWQQVLFNQFHDILPGTAIPEVFVTANQSWAAAAATAQGIRAEALAAIAPTLPCPAPPQANAVPLLLFNSLNWAHTDLVEVPLSALPTQTARWRVFDPDTGAWTPTQRSDYTDQTTMAPGQATPPPPPAPRLLLQATVPALGYRWVWLVPDADPAPVPPAAPAAWTLSNDFLQAVIDPATGEVVTLTAHATGQTVVRSPANQLQAFQDAGQYWDAWDIAPNYESHPLPAATVQALTWLETGPLRQRLRVVRQIADSTVQQDYVLDSPLPYLKVATVADWHATQVVLKTAFPLSFSAPQATYEIPFGAIARPTASEDPHAQAKWEVPAYRWADMGNGDRGLSVLTDYKHGFDAKPDQLRLTLLKAPLWPDPQADRGYHGFTYGLYPHGGDWRAAQTPTWAIAFNTPLQWLLPNPIAPGGMVPSSGQWWPSQTTGTHLAALKLAEDDPDQYILRLWELYGTEVTVDLGTATVERTDLLEAAIAVDAPHRLTPWQIATFKVALPPPHSGGTQTNPTPPH